MSIMQYNGSAVIAMKGKDCVAIAADTRLGIQYSTISTEFQKIFEVSPGVFTGISGLATDVQTVIQKLQFRVNMYELKENRKVSPKVFNAMFSKLLYSRRFGYYFVEPVIAGIDQRSGEPFVGQMDLLGSTVGNCDFAAAGTAEDQMVGMCEALWEPDLSPDELFEVISQVLLNSVDRDAMAGWGGVVHIVEKDKITTRKLKARLD